MISKRIVTLMMGCSMLVACQQEDFGVNEQEVYTSAYNREFTNTFGNVNPGQTWDLTTRAMTEYKSVAEEDGWYYVMDETLGWFKDNMPENQDNHTKVKAFTLTTTEAQTFEVVPIFQGGSDYLWTVEMLVNGEVVWSWKKGQEDRLWHKNYADNWKVAGTASSDKTDGMKGARAKTAKVDVEANSTIYFRIKSESPVVNGKDHTSIETPTWIGVLDVPTPKNVTSIDPSYTCKVITCEGQRITTSGTEKPDFNEVAFMLVGYVPQVVFEDQEVVTTTTKRYMMEDMGSIDWDFNDVVVDVTTTTKAWYTINTETGVTTIKRGTTPAVTTTAKIAHLGGTYPVQVTVGRTELPKISDPLNHEQTEAQLSRTFSGTPTYGYISASNPGWEPTAAAEVVEGYDPATNKVSIRVWKDFNPALDPDTATDSQTTVWTTTFPVAGATPFIVAVRSYDVWTAEGDNVTTASWWNDLWGKESGE